jgi:hypothetical protein
MQSAFRLVWLSGMLAVALTCFVSCGGDSVESGSPAYSCQEEATACLAELAGDYAGTYRGDATGTWEVTIDNDGTLSGTVVNNEYGYVYDLDGQSDENGAVVFGTVSDGSTFSGQIHTDGSISGTWSMGDHGGSFSGRRK